MFGCRGRQLAQLHHGHRPHRQNGMRPHAVRTTNLARQRGHSFRHRTHGRPTGQTVAQFYAVEGVAAPPTGAGLSGLFVADS